MINLIPPQARTAVTREYWTRVVSVWGFLFGGIAVALIALLVPTYLLVHLQLVALEQQIYEGADTENAVRAAEVVVEDANILITQLHRTAHETHTSTLFGAITDAAGARIALSALAVEEGPEGTRIRVQGVAATRSALVDFQNVVQQSPLFAEVVVPVSDLAREIDAPFTMTMLVANAVTE